MDEAGKGKNTGRYIIESRMDELPLTAIKEFNILNFLKKEDNWGISQVRGLEMSRWLPQPRSCVLSALRHTYIRRRNF